MDKLAGMKVFAAVAQEQSFAAAARRLAMSPPAVTRAVSALEDTIGARLFTRTTRRVALTEAGARYLHDCERILLEIGEAEAAAGGLYAQPAGMLTITAPALFGRYYIAPMLPEFLDLYPAVEARLILLDRTTNLVDEGMDLAIRIGRLPDSNMAAVRVGSVRQIICAAPTYLKEHGVPCRPEDLRDHNIISSSPMRAMGAWRFRTPEGEVEIHPQPRLECNTNDAVIEVIETGWGLTRLLSYQVGPLVNVGRLRLVLEEFEPEPVPVHIVHPEGRRAAAKVRAFVDFAATRLRADPLVNPR